MTILMNDATEQLRHDNPDAAMHVSDLVCADDTLLMGTHPDHLHAFMMHIDAAGKEYGLAFNWSKLETLPMRMNATIRKPDGEAIKVKERMVYLGSMLAADGRIYSELNRRIGQAKADFDKLKQVWSHSNMSTKRKLRFC